MKKENLFNLLKFYVTSETKSILRAMNYLNLLIIIYKVIITVCPTFVSPYIKRDCRLYGVFTQKFTQIRRLSFFFNSLFCRPHVIIMKVLKNAKIMLSLTYENY